MEQFFWQVMGLVEKFRVSGETISLVIRNSAQGTITRAGELSFDFTANDETVEIWYNEIVDFNEDTIWLYVPTHS